MQSNQINRYQIKLPQIKLKKILDDTNNATIENDIKRFHDIGKKTGTDKITTHFYHRYYPYFLNKQINTMLEIGIDKGKSVPLWLEYLPNVQLFGLDINQKESGDNFTIIKGDQSNITDLQNVVSTIGKKIEFIIDDGSHVPEHQLLSFNYLFENLLQDGGTYIIEDIECNYWRKGQIYGYPTKYGLDNDNNIINIFTNAVHLLNQKFMRKSDMINLYGDLKISDNNMDKIEMIAFGRNCIVITKKVARDYENTTMDTNDMYMYSNSLDADNIDVKNIIDMIANDKTK